MQIMLVCCDSIQCCCYLFEVRIDILLKVVNYGIGRVSVHFVQGQCVISVKNQRCVKVKVEITIRVERVASLSQRLITCC